jgi:hypothetical protein
MPVQTLRCRCGLVAHLDGTLRCDDAKCRTAGDNPEAVLRHHVVVVVCRQPGCDHCI